MAAPARALAARRGSNVPRILIGGYQHEGHSFVPGVLTLDDMAVSGYVVEGPTMLTTAIGDDHEVSGAIDVARAAGVELIPTVHAWGGVGPAIEDVAYRFFEEQSWPGSVPSGAGSMASTCRSTARRSRRRAKTPRATSSPRSAPRSGLISRRRELRPARPHDPTDDRRGRWLLPYRTCPHTDFRRHRAASDDAAAGRAPPAAPGR